MEVKERFQCAEDFKRQVVGAIIQYK